MKLLVIAFASLLLLSAPVHGQTVETLIANGRSQLQATNLTAAHTNFSAALTMNPIHPEANTFYAVTRLLMLMHDPALSNLLTRAGVPTSGRDIWNWTAFPALDTNGLPVIPDAFHSQDFLDLFETNILLELIGSELNLSKVTTQDFTLLLDAPNLTPETLTLDYADVLMARAIVLGAIYGGYSALYWNLQTDVGNLRQLHRENLFNAEAILNEHPAFLTVRTTNYLQAATNALHRAIDLYLQSSEIIRTRSTNTFYMFNYDPEAAREEETFRTCLGELRESLDRRVVPSLATNYTAFLGALLSADYSLRDFFPIIQSNSFVIGSLPDPTAGGLLEEVSTPVIDGYLAEKFDSVASFAPTLRAGSDLVLQIMTATGHGYVLQTSTDLVHWSDELGFFGDEQGVRLLEPAMNLDQRRFYRVVERTNNMPPPLNDMFVNAETIPGLNTQVRSYTCSATNEFFEPTDTTGHTVWWKWQASVSSLVEIVASGIECPVVSVFVGASPGSLTKVAGGYETVQFQAQAGQLYYVSADTCSEDGEIRLTITRPPVLMVTSPNDGAEFISPAAVTFSGIAWDPDGGPLKLKWRHSDGLEFPTVGSTFDFTLTNIPGGWYGVSLVVEDSAGAQVERWLDFSVHPPNDDFQNPSVLSGFNVDIKASARGSTVQDGEPNHGLEWGADNSIWWLWTAPSSGPVSVSVENSYAVCVYTGNILTNLTEVTSEQEQMGLSVVSFQAIQGVAYRIACVSYSDEDLRLKLVPSFAPSIAVVEPKSGDTFYGPTNVTLVVNCADTDGVVTNVGFYLGNHLLGTRVSPPWSIVWSNAQPERGYQIYAYAQDNAGIGRFSDPIWVEVLWPPPQNDSFDRATPIQSIESAFTEYNLRATAEPGEPSHDDVPPNASIWWSWIAPNSGPISLLCRSRYSWSEPRIAVYTGQNISNLVRVASDSHAYDRMSVLGFHSLGGVKYFICYDSSYDEQPTLKLLATSQPQVSLNSPQTGVSYLYPTNLLISASVYDVDGGVSNVVFFVDGRVISKDSQHPFECFWQAPSPGNYILAACAEDVAGARSYSKPVTITVLSSIPANDMMADAIPLNGDYVLVTGVNAMASQELTEPTLFAAPEKSVWWVWQAAKNGLATVSTVGSNFDTILGVYNASSFQPSALVAKDDDAGGGGASLLSFQAQTGMYYYIKVAGFSGSTGSITLKISQP